VVGDNEGAKGTGIVDTLRVFNNLNIVPSLLLCTNPEVVKSKIPEGWVVV